MEIPAIPDRVALDNESETRDDPVLLKVFGPFKGHVDDGVVLIVFADAVHSVDHPNPMPLQTCRRADTGKHENLRRVVDAGA